MSALVISVVAIFFALLCGFFLLWAVKNYSKNQKRACVYLLLAGIFLFCIGACAELCLIFETFPKGMWGLLVCTGLLFCGLGGVVAFDAVLKLKLLKNKK